MSKEEKSVKREEIYLLKMRNDPNRFVLLSDGFVLDKLCKIERGPTAPNQMNKKDAMDYCEAMGCFLEEAEEAESLIDRSNDPCLLKTYPAPMKTDDGYWTNTKTLWNTSASFVVSFGFGNVGYNREDGKYYVRPVRASQ